MKAIVLLIMLAVGVAGTIWTVQIKDGLTKTQDERIDNLKKNNNVEDQIEDVEGEIKVEESNLKTAQTEKAEAETRLDQVNGELASLKRKAAQVQNVLDGKDSSIDEVTASIADLKKEFDGVELDGAESEFDLDGFEAEAFAERMRKKYSGEIDALKGNIEENELLISQLDSNVEQNRSEIDRLNTKSSKRNARVAKNAMEARVAAVDNEWGFVVIGAGHSSGFSPQTRLLVKRDGQIIAELQPTSVEASQTIANIDPVTVMPGVRIQRGDKVIPMGVEVNNN